MSTEEELIARNEAAKHNSEKINSAGVALWLEWSYPLRTVIRDFMTGGLTLFKVEIPEEMPPGFEDYADFYVAEYHRLVLQMVDDIFSRTGPMEIMDFTELEQFLTLIGISRRYLDVALSDTFGAEDIAAGHLEGRKWLRV